MARRTLSGLSQEARQFVKDGDPREPEPEVPIITELKIEAEPPPVFTATLTTKVTGATYDRLRREAFRRRVDGESPRTIQEITEEALHRWLQENEKK